MYEAYCVYKILSNVYTHLLVLSMYRICMHGHGLFKKNVSLLATSCAYEFLMIVTISSDYMVYK